MSGPGLPCPIRHYGVAESASAERYSRRLSDRITEGYAAKFAQENERIVVAGREFVSARLTPAAYAHGLALALPEIVAKARPTGVGHALDNLPDPDRRPR